MTPWSISYQLTTASELESPDANWVEVVGVDLCDVFELFNDVLTLFAFM